MEDADRTEQAILDTTLTAPGTVPLASGDVCPRCHQAYARSSIQPPEYKCNCGLELAYPNLSPGGEVRGVLGWLASPGTIVHQRYRVVQLLGRGGFGSTYLVEDQKLSNKRWALKEIPEAMYDEHESRILSKLNHPSIPGIIDREITGGMVYMVLEFGGSRTLETVRRAAPDKKIALSQMAPWVRQLCDVLAYIHAQSPPIVHRDLKPGNVLLDDKDRVMLIDFGIAKEAIASEQTRALGRAVTHGFSPPEQAMGSGTDARSDVYALSATIYYMLTAQRPPGARERIQGSEILLPSSLASGIPPAIDRALLQAMSLNPNERQQTVEEFGRAFDYDAPTVKTYEEYAAPERTVLVGSATTRSVPTTTPQKSLKLGPDGGVVLEQGAPASQTASRTLLILAAAGLAAVAALGTYWFMQREAAPLPATAAVAPVAPEISSATPPSPVPVLAPSAPTPPAAAPPTTLAPSVATLPTPSAPAGPTAMEELLKRRQSSIAAPAAVLDAPKPRPKPVKPRQAKPAQVAAKVAPPPAPAAPGPVVSAPAPAAPAASAWQKANANTQFQE